MRNEAIHMGHSHSVEIPPGWMFLGFLGGSWVAAVGVAQLGAQIFAAIA